MPTDFSPRSPRGAAVQSVAVAALALVTLALSLSGCPKSYPDCDGDSTCASHHEVCVNDRCRQCRDDSQCAKLDACMSCQANECVRRPGCCKSNLDCPDGRCLDGKCGPQCEANSDCPDGQHCISGKCSVETGCTNDSQCPTGLHCKDGTCTTACEVKPIYFDFNEYAIRLDQEAPLQSNTSCLKESAQTSVTVEGHTDERGSDEYNLTLGQRRANSVAGQYRVLGVKGLTPTLSFGEEKPVCSGSGEHCWRQNRRAETKVR